MDLSVGIIHLDSEPLSLDPGQLETLRDISPDLLLGTPCPEQHLHLEDFNLVAPLIQDGGILAALHALLMAARHPRLLALFSPLDREQLALARELAHSQEGSDLLIHTRSAGAPALPARLDQACLRPLERALLLDPRQERFPPGIRAHRL